MIKSSFLFKKIGGLSDFMAFSGVEPSNILFLQIRFFLNVLKKIFINLISSENVCCTLKIHSKNHLFFWMRVNKPSYLDPENYYL